MQELEEEVLAAFISKSFGYGTYEAPYWLIGMEEGGCDSPSELKVRLDAWDQRGRRDLEDLVDYHGAIGESRWFGPKPKLQKTWSQLIRVVCSAEGTPTSVDAVRAYQSQRLGRSPGETCLLELLPLPASSTNIWPYSAVGDLHFLASREEYKKELLPGRIEHIKSRIREYQPRAVVCYSFRYREHWDQLADSGFEEQSVEGKTVLVGGVGGTPLLVVPHPVARGMTNGYYEAVGKLLGRFSAGDEAA